MKDIFDYVDFKKENNWKLIGRDIFLGNMCRLKNICIYRELLDVFGNQQ